MSTAPHSGPAKTPNPTGTPPAFYGAVARALHWLTALLIVAIIPLGVIAHEMAFELRTGAIAADAMADTVARVGLLFSLHKTLGVTLFFTALLRIFWALTHPKPAPLHPDRWLETLAGETVHWLLYGALVIVPLSGWIHHAATTGFAPIWGPLGQNLPFVPKDAAIADFFAALHNVFSKVLVASISLHILGAVKHVVIDKDDTLRRMTRPSAAMRSQNNTAPHIHSRAPFFGALVVWAAALGIGAALGVFGGHQVPEKSAHVTAPVSETQNQSNWQVEDGTLSFSVVQFGTAVAGSFANWDAQIRFQAPPEGGQGDASGDPLGDVLVTIAIPSLTLGSVTDQAFDEDFFDAQNFPTAQFKADIFAAPEGGNTYIAKGTMRIKDQSVALALPFDLVISGDTAQMKGQITMDRRDFAIGNTMPDEGSLGFAVVVDIALSARNKP